MDYSLSASGLYLPQDFKRYPTCLDLFCGCGGFSLGMIHAGFEVVAGLEHDCAAAHTYMTNLGSYPINIHYTSEKYRQKLKNYFEKHFNDRLKRSSPIYSPLSSETIVCLETSGSGHVKRCAENDKPIPPVRNFFFGDVREVSGRWMLDKLGILPGELDCICGGPPCQGFSHAGKRNVMDPRNSLVFEFARLVCEMRPKTMIMENVQGIINMITPVGLPVVDAFCQVLEDGGFGTSDALKRSLVANSGSGAAIRNKRTGKSSAKTHKDSRYPKPDAQQLNIFSKTKTNSGGRA